MSVFWSSFSSATKVFWSTFGPHKLVAFGISDQKKFGLQKIRDQIIRFRYQNLVTGHDRDTIYWGSKFGRRKFLVAETRHRKEFCATKMRFFATKYLVPDYVWSQKILFSATKI